MDFDSKNQFKPTDLSKVDNEIIHFDTSDKIKIKKDDGSLRKYIMNISLVLIVTIISTCITIFSDLESFKLALGHIQWNWIFISIGVVVCATLLRALGLFCFAKLYTRKYHYHQALAVDQIGVFYNGVTPGASGGQFVQAYTFKKQGLNISHGASIMVMSSIIYQILLVIFGLISFAVEYSKIMSINAIEFTINDVLISVPFLPIIIFGFLLNVSVIVLLFSMSYSTKFHHFILGPCISFLSKIHLLKNPDKTRENIRVQVENFKIELKRLASNIPFTILISVITIGMMILTFSVPCFAGKALGASYDFNATNLFDSIFLSNFHQMVTGLIPIPGSAGISEYVFAQLFSEYYGMLPSLEGDYSIVTAVLLLWRTITFTLPLLIGGIVTAFYKASPKDEVNRTQLNRETFVSLQRETFIERKESADTLFETRHLTRSAIMDSLMKRNKEEEKQRKERQRIEREKELKKKSPGYSKIELTDWNEIDITDEDD